jgi:hypothetical protein
MLNKLVWTAFFGLIAIGFTVSCVLRARVPDQIIDHDAVNYLTTATAIEIGQQIEKHERPLGYSYIIAGLCTVGFRSDAALIYFNVLCVGAGLAAFAAVARREIGLAPWQIVCVLSWVLCSYLVLDMATTAPPEMMFITTTMSALLCVSMSQWSHRPMAWILGAIILMATSIAPRTVGVALVLAVLWRFRHSLLRARVVLFAWSYPYARFWVPITPCLFAFFMVGPCNGCNALRRIAWV